MKNVLFSIFLSMMSVAALAQGRTSVTAICLKPEMIDQITKHTGEELIWVGTVERDNELGTAALYVHPKTGSWSYVEHWQGFSCVIGGGDYSRNQLPKKPAEKT